MSGHPRVSQVKEQTSIISVMGGVYNVHLSFHTIKGIEGYVAGLKFTDQSNSMDSSKRGNVSGLSLGKAISREAVRLIQPELKNISVFGFYLLTDDLADRSERAVAIKKKVYGAQAIKIHGKVSHELPFLNALEVEGGLGWAMSRDDFNSYDEFHAFEDELSKNMQVLSC
jgi:hypothetical protein